MKDNTSPIDMHRLPSQTESAFWIIVIVILGTAIISLFSNAPIQLWPIVLCLLILPARAVLKIPDRELDAANPEAMAALEDEGILSELQAIVGKLSAEIPLSHPVRILIGSKPYEVRVCGSWRQHYLFLGAAIARKLHADWQDTAHQPKVQALILHELAHLRNKDVQRIGYTRILLWDTVLIPCWWFLLSLALIAMVFSTMPTLLAFDPGAVDGVDPIIVKAWDMLMTPIRSDEAEITQRLNTTSPALFANYAGNAFFLLVMTAFVLWLFYWRRMLRLREHDADYFAAQTLGDDMLVLRAFGRYPGWIRPKATQTHARFDLREQITRIIARLAPKSTWRSRATTRWKRWFAVHPTYLERYNYLKDPLVLNRDWLPTGVAIGVLVLTLEILLTSPLAAYHLSEFPTLFFTTTIFVLMSTWWMPLLVAGEPSKHLVFKMVGLVFAIRYLWLLLTFGVLIVGSIIAPELTWQLLNNLVRAISGYVSNADADPPLPSLVTMLSWIPSYLFIQLVPLFAVALALWLYYRALRPSLADTATLFDWRRRHWRNVLLIVTSVTLLFLQPLTYLAGSNGAGLLQPFMLAGYAIGAIALVVLWRLNRTP